MASSSKKTNTAPSLIEDVAYLTRAEHRVPALLAVSERPRSRSELCALTGVSSSTIRRTLRAFEERHWVQRTGHQYESTQSGAYVAAAMADLFDRLQTEQRLRDVWHWTPGEDSGFTIEMCSGAVVTVAEPDAPYCPVNRFEALLRETDSFRFVGSDIALLEPCKDALRERIRGGMTAEIIDPPNVARYILSTYPEHSSVPLEQGNLTVLLHDDLPPYGVGLFDERIAVSCYDETSGTVRMLIDTDGEDAREWAESVYATFRSEAGPLALEPLAE